MHDGRCSFRRNLVPNIPNHPGNHGPLSSPTSLRGQQTLFGGSFLGLRNLFHQLFAPGVLRQPYYSGNGTRSEFLGFCIEFEPFALRYSPPRDFNQVMAPFSASPLAVQLSGFVSRLFLVAKCAHPAPERTRGFAALFVQSCGLSESDLTAAAKPIRRYLHTSSLW